jgi:hypothetical protein
MNQGEELKLRWYLDPITGHKILQTQIVGDVYSGPWEDVPTVQEPIVKDSE